MTHVFLTVDTEFAWRHHVVGLDAGAIYARSIEPAGVGLSYQLGLLERHGLKACFFVDPMPAMLWGLEPFRRIVGAILDAGQEVQCTSTRTGPARAQSTVARAMRVSRWSNTIWTRSAI